MSTAGASSMLGVVDTGAVIDQARAAAAQGRQIRTLLNSKGKTAKQVRETARDFEAFFLSQMLQPMFNTVKTDPMFGGGHGEDMWKSLMVDEYAKKIANSGGVGIADQVMRVMIQAQANKESA